MHLALGIIRIGMAKALAVLYRALPAGWFGRCIVRICCAAFTAGAGLDDAAVDVVRGLGPGGIRLLEQVAQRGRHRMVASLMLEMIRVAPR